MRKGGRGSLLTAGLWIGGVLLAGSPLATAPALAAQEELIDKAKALFAEAQPHLRDAMDTEQDAGVRRTGRKEAHKRLKEARDLLNRWCDANPGREEQIDRDLAEVQSALHFVRKMMSVGEMNDRDEPPPPVLGPPRSSGGSGIGGAGPREPTPPPQGGKPEPEPEPEAAAPPDPAVLAREAYAEIEAWEREHRSDLPGLQTLLEQFLSQYPDTTYPEYTKAALRLGEISDRMRAVVKEITQEDPDGIEGIDSKEVSQVVTRLNFDINGKDRDARVRAARLLGRLGTGLASYSLVKTLRDDDEELRKLCHDGLVQIGGPRTAWNLVKLYRDSPEEHQESALAVLMAIASKSRADARAMSVPLGRFGLSRKDAVAGRALDFLVGLGPAGGPGLVEALGETELPKKKLFLIDAIAKARYYKGTVHVAKYLLQGDGNTQVLRNAAIESLNSMGVHAVPHLIPMLQSGRHRLWVAEVLRQLTGTRYGANDAKKFRQWYDENKPKDAE